MESNEYISIEEFIKAIAVRYGREPCPKTVQNWCLGGWLPGAYRIQRGERGRPWAIPRKLVETFVIPRPGRKAVK